MIFEKINYDKWARKETFEHFMNVAKSTYSLTVKVDVTNLVQYVKEKQLHFFTAFTWVVTKAINEHKQFRMGYDEEGCMGYYSSLNPSYPVLDEEENVVTLSTEYSEDFHVFYDRMRQDIGNYKRTGKVNESTANMLLISTLPWLNYENFTVVNESEYHFLFPMVTWGKYSEENGRWYIPLSIQISHAAADGYHCVKFYQSVENTINEFLEM